MIVLETWIGQPTSSTVHYSQVNSCLADLQGHINDCSGDTNHRTYVSFELNRLTGTADNRLSNIKVTKPFSKSNEYFRGLTLNNRRRYKHDKELNPPMVQIIVYRGRVRLYVQNTFWCEEDCDDLLPTAQDACSLAIFSRPRHTGGGKETKHKPYMADVLSQGGYLLRDCARTDIAEHSLR